MTCHAPAIQAARSRQITRRIRRDKRRNRRDNSAYFCVRPAGVVPRETLWGCSTYEGGLKSFRNDKKNGGNRIHLIIHILAHSRLTHLIQSLPNPSVLSLLLSPSLKQTR
ncbi:hypothetical protein Y032_0298g1754 [Ancylostoma ceylanicum]|uniref:Uncharacterized protein n=1 Tax=Ancylostoma ceylanicum TaxID=53326 RepID=A0A016S440_9BILA|nr:hypothetical protein Y032_0298g1754 [Ancylostoma ceylanicum]